MLALSILGWAPPAPAAPPDQGIASYQVKQVATLIRPPMGNGAVFDQDRRLVLSTINNHNSAPAQALGYTVLLYYDERDGVVRELHRFEEGQHWESAGDLYRTPGGIWRIAPELLEGVSHDPNNNAFSFYAPDLSLPLTDPSRTQYRADAAGGGGGPVGFAAYQRGVEVLAWGSLLPGYPGHLRVYDGGRWSAGAQVGGYVSAAYVFESEIFLLCPLSGTGSGLWRFDRSTFTAERIGPTPDWSWGKTDR